MIGLQLPQSPTCRSYHPETLMETSGFTSILAPNPYHKSVGSNASLAHEVHFCFAFRCLRISAQSSIKPSKSLKEDPGGHRLMQPRHWYQPRICHGRSHIAKKSQDVEQVKPATKLIGAAGCERIGSNVCAACFLQGLWNLRAQCPSKEARNSKGRLA